MAQVNAISLQKIAIETIRKNFCKYPVDREHPMFDIIWQCWSTKFQNRKGESWFPIFEAFIKDDFVLLKALSSQMRNVRYDDSEKVISISNQSNKRRAYIYQLLDDVFGLHHISLVITKTKKNIHVFKPAEWCFEYTTLCEHSQEAKRRKRDRNHRRREKKPARPFRDIHYPCCSCEKYALDCDLIFSYYDGEIYCEVCFDITVTHNGDPIDTYANEKLENIL
eukprot:767685-Hanusia_phi.AAC.3